MMESAEFAESDFPYDFSLLFSALMVTSRASLRSHWPVRVGYAGVRFLQNILRRSVAAVTVQTPAHIERPKLMNAGHTLHISVTSFTGHPFCNMPLMGKVNVVRKLMDPNPLNGLSILPGLTNFLNQRAIRLHDRMTIHADVE